MTPAERVADWRQCGFLTSEEFDKLLALAEAVPARLAAGHSHECAVMDYHANACTCGHDALAAAWAALGDDHGRQEKTDVSHHGDDCNCEDCR